MSRKVLVVDDSASVRQQVRLALDEAGFETVAGTWVTIQIPFSDLRPTFRGRQLRNMPALEGAAVRQIGFMIADKQEGPFRLEIDWIKAYEGAT